MHFKALLSSKDMNGRQHSATGVLPHHFHTQMSLHKLWVANCSLASTSAISYLLCNCNWPELRKNIDSFQGTPVCKEMDSRQPSSTGVLPHAFNTQISLHKLWIAKLQPCFHLSYPTYCCTCRTQAWPKPKSQSLTKGLLINRNMDGRQHSATGVLTHPFRT